jgi:hypothetical protein
MGSGTGAVAADAAGAQRVGSTAPAGRVTWPRPLLRLSIGTWACQNNADRMR